MDRAIIVLGQGRSGTSVTAGILHHLGVFMGDAPSRFWEDGAFYNVHQAMVGDWRDPKPDVAPYFARYRDLIAQRRTHPLWGLKDPRLCFLFFTLLPLLDGVDVRIIYTSRPLADITRSLSEFPGVESAAEAERIARMYRDALNNTKKLVPSSWPTMTMRYNQLVKNPLKQVARIAKFVSVSVTDAAVSLVKTK